MSYRDDCEELHISDASMTELITDIQKWANDLSEENIVVLEELTREWRETH